MTIVFGALAVLVVGLLLALLVQRLPVAGLEAPVGSAAHVPLPDGLVRADDLLDLRFDQTLRGYRMSEVDAVLEALGEQLRARDAEIAQLRQEVAPS